MQYEFEFRDWRPMFCAPTNAAWVELQLEDSQIVRAHFACDLSGSEQPAFMGWYVDAGSYFRPVHPRPYRWRYDADDRERAWAIQAHGDHGRM